MSWYLAHSIRRAFDEANARYPNRNKASDGTIGDQAHSSRTSDHNPCSCHGVVHAGDFTDDPRAGFDAHGWVRNLSRHGDARIKYWISNGKIWNPTSSAWGTYQRLRAEGHSRLEAARMALPGERTYSGSNGHYQHAHISIKHSDQARNDGSTWFYSDLTQFDPATPPQEDDDVAYRYEINGQIWTTDLVWKQHWEVPGAGLDLIVRNTKDLGKVTQDFHDSLADIAKTVDAVNYADDAQKRLVSLEAKVDQLLAKP